MPVGDPDIHSHSAGKGIDGRDMSSPEKADEAMKEIVDLIDKKLLDVLNEHSDYETYIREFVDSGWGTEEDKEEMHEKLLSWKATLGQKTERSRNITDPN